MRLLICTGSDTSIMCLLAFSSLLLDKRRPVVSRQKAAHFSCWYHGSMGASVLLSLTTRRCNAVQVPELLVWIERFREWLASQLLVPLSDLMVTAHIEPNTLMAKLVPGRTLCLEFIC